MRESRSIDHRGGGVMGPSTEAPAAGPDAAESDWLELFEPVRPLATTRFTRNIQCRDREGRAVVVREIRPAAHWHAGERVLAIAALRREAEVLTALQGT